jgi:hypothetical protein
VSAPRDIAVAMLDKARCPETAFWLVSLLQKNEGELK